VTSRPRRAAVNLEDMSTVQEAAQKVAEDERLGDRVGDGQGGRVPGRRHGIVRVSQ